MQRQLYDAVCDTLRLKTDAASSHGKARLHRPDPLCYQMARRFGIPHVFYELNNGKGGKHRATQDTLHLFEAAVQTLTATLS